MYVILQWKAEVTTTRTTPTTPTMTTATTATTKSHHAAAAELILSQKAINDEIVKLVRQASSEVTFISMMSQYNDPHFLSAIQKAQQKGVKVHLFHNVNPYVCEPHRANDDSTLDIHNFIQVKTIPMHGKRLWNCLSSLMGSYVNPMHTNVTHSRLLLADTYCLFGGVDLNRACEANSYVQSAIRINMKNPPIGFQTSEVDNLVQYLHTNASLMEYNFQKGGCIIGTSCDDTSAFDRILLMIKSATELVFIENQYFQHIDILTAIAKRQRACPKLRVVFVGNEDFRLNVYHPGSIWLLKQMTNYVLQRETNGALKILKKQGCRFNFRVYKGKYTHNKVFICDDGIAMGTFNLHSRSLDSGYDCELGVILEEQKELVHKYLNYVFDRTEDRIVS